uniref:Uncharacterized protein n=1 Tax=Kalanchoe fedtschenkoi TaxID=63787 RepID=A0A7N0U508_KALFE
MAATVSAWATKPGAWALDAEEHEEELQKQRTAMDESKSSAADFPSLSAAVATKGGKKKKGPTLSLAEFANYSAPKANQARGVTQDDLMNLPTGPRERTAEEMDMARGGFRSYGMGRSGGGGGDGDRWGANRGSDETRRPRGEPREPLGPSRADEIDNWAAGKKPAVAGGGGGFDRRERTGGSFFGSDSKADESDSWVSKKAPSEPPRRFGSGGGFERERRSYEPFTANGGAGADSDSWGRRREERVVNAGENGQAGATGGRPKLNLQPRSLPLERPQSPNVAVVKPQSPDVQSPVVVKPRSFNPFGEARPREEVLAEKGQDWKRIDEKLESLKIKEVGGGDGSDGPAKKGLGASGGWRGSAGEERTERSWRKPESVEDSRPTSAGNKSAEKIEENGSTGEK